MSLGAAKRDVFDLGATAFTKRQKKVLEAEKAVAFGKRHSPRTQTLFIYDIGFSGSFLSLEARKEKTRKEGSCFFLFR